MVLQGAYLDVMLLRSKRSSDRLARLSDIFFSDIGPISFELGVSDLGERQNDASSCYTESWITILPVYNHHRDER